MLSTRDEMVRDILIGMFSALAKLEAVKLSERTKAGLARAKKDRQRLSRSVLKLATKDKTTITRLSRESMRHRKIVEAINRDRKKEAQLSRKTVERVLAGTL